MKEQSIRKSFVLIVCLFFVLFFRENGFAASSPIRNIRVKVQSRLEPGDSPGDIRIEGAEAEAHEVVAMAKGSNFTITKAEWGSGKKSYVTVGDELKVVLVLSPVDVTTNFFQAAYHSGTFHIEGGSYVSAKREGDDLHLTVKLKAVQGRYDAPVSVDWNARTLGQVSWTPGQSDSHSYQVQLFRNGNRIFELARLNATQYNFYPYMTKAGNYTVRVKTILKNDKEKNYAGSSTYSESSELVIDDRDVSDGKGRVGDKVVSGTEKKVGWDKDGNEYVYRLPSGALLTGWGHIGGYWYYFRPDGKMAKRWENVSGKWYFFHDNGDMAVGWIKDNNNWYYLVPDNEAVNGLVSGEMLGQGWHVISGRYYYMEESGRMHKGWLLDQGRWYYLNELENSLEGVMFSGFMVRNEKTYYLNSNGAMETGWVSIDGNWYYFQKDSGEMLRNTWVDGFPLNADGILDENSFRR